MKLTSTIAGWVILVAMPLLGQDFFEHEPINYLKAKGNDPVTRLQKRIDQGQVELKYESKHGYLKSILEHLNVSPKTQMLVFSKTSFQIRKISPRTPRAVYFGDDVYIGWVQGGEVMEFSAVDPQLGTNFYSLSQRETDPLRFTRHTHECLQCHSSSLTRGVPGHLVRSLYVAPDGIPIYRAGTYVSDHSSPLEERWGGWYVTGKHGAQRHMGNMLVRQADDPRKLSKDRGANLTDLGDFFRTSTYLTGHSDIVALMVLEHQVNMHNRITRANFQTRVAQRDEQVMNKMLERPADHRSASTVRRVQAVAIPVVEHMLFCKEIALTAPISGESGFTEEFATLGPRDKQGRSLRDFDLKTRMFKYPCSYLIYSESFDKLPKLAKDEIYQRLWNVLTEKDTSDKFSHLSTADRQAILEILRETKRGLPKYWQGELAVVSDHKLQRDPQE